MKAVIWSGPHNVRVERVKDPEIVNPKDAILRVTATAICGSDLHLYNGFMPTMKPGDILGHEFMGIVEEVGPEVRSVRPGDRVVVPFNIACGNCEPCMRELGRCAITRIRMRQWPSVCTAILAPASSGIRISSAATPADKPNTCAFRLRISAAWKFPKTSTTIGFSF